MSELLVCKRKYGWRKDLPSRQPWFDHRKLLARMPNGTPDKTENRQYIKWVYDQGQEGSCTANSGLGAERFFRSARGLPDFDGSRQFLYYVTRDMEGTADSDSGATISDTEQAMQTLGVCHEELWPYTSDFTVKPTPEAYTNALDHQVLVKSPVEQTEDALEACLAAKQPIHYGMTVYESFESSRVAQTGIVPMPGWFDKALGGHALWLFDYDRPNKVAYGQNSWGAQWGQDSLGIFQIPYKYLFDTDYASDFWTISSLEV